jgi:hypothetical protein
MHRRQGLLTLGAFLILMVVILVQGCGLKADPAPSQIKPFKPVADLKLQEKFGGIFIQWRVQEQPIPMTRFKIMRSEFGTEGQGCPGCPPDEVRIADLVAGEAKLVSVSGNVFGYQDTGLKSGHLYRYRVIGCGQAGSCSEASVTVELKIPADAVSGKAADSEPKRKDPQENKFQGIKR